MTRRHVVLVLVKGLGLGGAEKLLAEGARFWDRDRFDYHVAYVLPAKDQLVGAFADRGIPVHALSRSGRTSPALARRLRRLVADTHTDLVHVHLPVPAVVARLSVGVPVVYTEHNLAHTYHPVTRWANRLTYRRNRLTIACSEAVAESLAGYPSRVVTIPNGVACDLPAGAAEAARAALDLPADVALLVHVGNIRPDKGHDNLIATAAALAEHGTKAQFVSIGVELESGDIDRLRADARAAGVAESVRFLGRRDDALAHLAAADVCVSPSHFEGLPIAVLEAMCLGRAVAATAVGGVPSVVRDGETGLLAPARDPEALAAAIGRLLEDSALRTRLGTAAQALVHDQFSLEAMVQRVEDSYAEVMAG